MRIAIINWSGRKAGGVETYLGSVLPELQRSGHEVAFWYEVDKPVNRERIALPASVPKWCVAELGETAALGKLRDWQPDLIYSHGLLDPKLERSTIGIAPAIFFAHSYYGTCISGTKTFKRPVVKPCDRRFGAMCLLHYFPHRCGGLNPMAMLQLYRGQARRLELVRSYKTIVTASEHMRAEYIKSGLDPERVHDLPYYVRGARQSVPQIEDLQRLVNIAKGKRNGSAIPDSTRNSNRREWRLLFLGRMDTLKGGSVFLDALPQVSAALERPLRITFAGDGPERHVWERKAKRVQSRHADVSIEFTGWLNGAQLDATQTNCDLLVLPSLWPEPFGLVGPEAGLRGVPVAAFAVGGILNWLVDGVNGHLASGDPPTAEGLAGAITKCLRDPATQARLGRGAAEMVKRFEMQNHMSALMKIFHEVLAGTL